MKAILILVFAVLLAFLGFGQKTNTPRIENVSWKLEKNQIIVSYEVINISSSDRLIVTLMPVVMPGKKLLHAASLSKGFEVQGSGKQQISWDFVKDGISFTGEEIYFEIKAVLLPNIKTSGAFAKSLIVPGMGQYQLNQSKPYWIWAALSYGLAASSVYFGMKSATDYKNYKSNLDVDESNSLFNSAQTNRNLAILTGVGAGAVWTINLGDVALKIDKIKGKGIDVNKQNDTNGSVLLSNVSKSGWIDTRPPFEIAKTRGDSLYALNDFANARAKYLEALKYNSSDAYCSQKVKSIDAQLAEVSNRKSSQEIENLKLYFKKAEEKYKSQIDSELKNSGLFNVEDEEFMTSIQLQERRKKQEDFKQTVLLDYAGKYKAYIEQLIRKSYTQVNFNLEITGNYNAESQEFPIKTNNQNFSVKIPRDEAKLFKTNVKDVKVIADKQLDETGENYHIFNYRAIHPTTGSEFLFGPQQKALFMNVDEGDIIGVPKLYATVKFVESNNNLKLDALESGEIIVSLENKGTGPAKTIVASMLSNAPETFQYDRTNTIPTLAPGETQKLIFKLAASKDIPTGQFVFNIDFKEAMGFKPDPVSISIEASEFIAPRLVYGGFTFTEVDGNKNGIIENAEIIEAMIDVINTGEGIAENASYTLAISDMNIRSLKKEQLKVDIGTLQPGQKVSKPFRFIVNNEYQVKQNDMNILPIGITITEKYMKYGSQSSLNIKIKENNDFAPALSDVDQDIPQKTGVFRNRFALVIGNEDYQSFQKQLGSEGNVPFARYDASRFKEYAHKVMGVPSENIQLLLDATSGSMSQAMDLIVKKALAFGPEAEIVLYYAGHGQPDEASKTPYLVPVDINASNLSAALKLTEVYSRLCSTNATRITVFIDACFSGGGRASGLMAATGGRTVRILPKMEAVSGNLVVFTASSGEQSSLPYKQKQHGLFTYFLLKKLKETGGNISYGELAEYLKSNVSITSLNVNQKEQTPQVNVGVSLGDTWKNYTIR